MRRIILLLCLSMFVSSAAFAAPKEKPKKGKPSDQTALDLFAPLTDDSNTKADGNIDDWNEESNKGVEFSTLLSGEYEYDWTGPKDLSANVRAQYGADKIYFLITVKDNAVVAKRKQWKSDKVELWLAPESAEGKSLGSKRGVIVDVGPQVDGGKATIKWNSGKAGGLEGSVFIDQDGYDIELSVDYSALSKEYPVKDGFMRYCVLVRDWDQDDENEDEASIGTCPINPKSASSLKVSDMGKIKLSLGQAMWNQIMAKDSQLSSIAANWAVLEENMGGSSIKETIGFAGDTLFVAGVGLNGASGISWSKMALDSGFEQAEPKLSLKDIDGDKVPEIIMTRTEHCTNEPMNADRTYLFKYEDSGNIRMLGSYVTEQRYDAGREGFVRNQYKLNKTDFVQTLDKASTKGMPECILKGALEMVPILMPEGENTSATHPYL